MTQEQKINRGTIIIFVLSIILVLCLCVTATLAYFAGNQEANTTLIMGGPVRVSMVNKEYEETYGQGNLVMNIKGNRQEILPGIGIDMQAIAKLTSSDINPTSALLRAKLDVEVIGLNATLAKHVQNIIRTDLGKCLTFRVDSSQQGARDGWVMFDDGNYYYCSQNKVVDPVTNQEYIAMKPISTSSVGNNITFINGTFQFPTQAYTNRYADVEIIFTLTFQAIQDQLVNDNGDRIPNTIFNVKQVLDDLGYCQYIAGTAHHHPVIEHRQRGLQEDVDHQTDGKPAEDHPGGSDSGPVQEQGKDQAAADFQQHHGQEIGVAGDEHTQKIGHDGGNRGNHRAEDHGTQGVGQESGVDFEVGCQGNGHQLQGHPDGDHQGSEDQHFGILQLCGGVPPVGRGKGGFVKIG